MNETKSKGFKIKTKGGENKMIRKLIVGAIVLNFAFILSGVITSTFNMVPSSFAANTTVGGPATVTVVGILELVNAGIKKIPASATGTINPWDPIYPSVSSFDFGTLQYVNGTYSGEYWYTTLMIPLTSGRKYKITETGSALTSGNATIPDTAFVQSPDYQAKDELPAGTPQGNIPSGAVVGHVSSAVGTNDVYTSDSAGLTRIIRGYVSVPVAPNNAQFKPSNFPGGFDINGVGVGTEYFYSAFKQADANTKPGDYDASVTYTLNLQ